MRCQACEREAKCRGFCGPCYARAYRAGAIVVKPKARRLPRLPNWLPVEPLRPHLEAAMEKYGVETDRRLGVSHGQVRHLLNRNRHVHIDTADRILIALGLPFDAVFSQEVA